MPPIKKIGGKIPEKDYLDGELISEVKHEYIGGYIYAMAVASRKHNLILSRICAKLKCLEKLRIGIPAVIF